MVKIKRHKQLFRTSLLSLILISLLAASAVFLSAVAADSVSDSDTRFVSDSNSNSIDEQKDVTTQSKLEKVSLNKNANVPADVLNTIKIYTDKNIDSDMGIGIIHDGTYAYADFGDGNLVDYKEYSNHIPGKTITIYTDGKISSLSFHGVNITSLDLSQCYEIDLLSFASTSITALDVSKHPSLRLISCGKNTNMTSIDASYCEALESLFCEDNNLESLNVIGCCNLEYIKCQNNQLTSLDLLNCGKLELLNCDHNKLTSLSNIDSGRLQFLTCSYNELTSLYLTDRSCYRLESLDCSYNKLESLRIASFYNYRLYCMGNYLKFSTIGKVLVGHFDEQKTEPLVIPSTVKVGEEITELSAEYVDENIRYYWNDGKNYVTPATSENGIFTFGNDAVGKTLRCTITHLFRYSGLTLRSTAVTILPNDELTYDDEFKVIDEDNIGVEAVPTENIELDNSVNVNQTELHISRLSETRIAELKNEISKTDSSINDSNAVYGYEITYTLHDGVTPVNIVNGGIEITLPYVETNQKDYTYKLYHNINTVEAFSKDSTGITFTATSFSPYLIAATKAKAEDLVNSDNSDDTTTILTAAKDSSITTVSENVQTGESNVVVYIAFVLTLVSLMAFSSAFVIKFRKYKLSRFKEIIK